MRTHTTLFTLALLACAVPLAASASPDGQACTDRPQSEWMKASAVLVYFESRGLIVTKFKREGSCYEVDASDKDGRRAEFSLNPVDASVVDTESKE